MSELLQHAQHPDADQLSAFAEDALPLHERQEMLGHLAICERCREVVALALPPLEETPLPRPVPERRPWFAGWGLLWPIGALSAVALVVFSVRPFGSGGSQTAAVTETAAVRAPEVPPLPQPAAPAAPMKETPVAPAPRRLKAEDAPRAKAGGGVAAVASAPVGIVGSESVGELPLANRQVAKFVEAAPKPVATVHGSAAGGAIRGPILRAGEMPSAAPARPPAALAFKVEGNAPAGTSMAQNPVGPPPRSANEEVSVQAAAIAMDTETGSTAAGLTIDGADLTDSRQMLVQHPLPSHLPVLSAAAAGQDVLAVDTGNKLFFSKDGGRHWKAVKAPWSGRAVRVSLSSATPIVPQLAYKARTPAPAVAAPPPPAPMAPPEDSMRASSLVGVVADSTGATIPGATVSIVNAGSGLKKALKTDQAGRYVFGGLPAGEYEMIASAPGFRTTRLTKVMLEVAQVRTEQLSLAVGAVAENVNVQSVQIETVDANSSGAVVAQDGREPKAGFEVTTDAGQRWTSEDGKKWQLVGVQK